MIGRRLRPVRFDDLHRVQWYRRLAVSMMPTGILQLLYNADLVVGKCTGDAAAASLAAVPDARDRHIPCRLPYLLPAADKVDARRRFVRASKKFRVFCSP